MLDLHTPWREDPAALRGRTRAMPEHLRLIASVERWVRGEPARPIWICGAPGSGRSHALALAVAAAHGRPAVAVHEDDADPAPLLVPPDAALIAVDRLDRCLDRLDPTDRRRVAAAWRRPDALWIGTADAPPIEVADFEIIELTPLPSADAGALLDAHAPAATVGSPSWAGRRRALLTLADGNPRRLLTLAQAAAGADAAASDDVLSALRAGSGELRARMAGLSDQQRQIVAAIAAAPGPTPISAVAAAVGAGLATAASQCRRLTEEGQLVARAGRSGRLRGESAPGAGPAHYDVADPLLRCWLGYRAAPWSTSQDAAVLDLIAHLGAPTPPADFYAGRAQSRLEEAARAAAAHPTEAHRRAAALVHDPDALDDVPLDALPAVLDVAILRGHLRDLAPLAHRHPLLHPCGFGWLARLAAALHASRFTEDPAALLRLCEAARDAPPRYKAWVGRQVVAAALRPRLAWTPTVLERRVLAQAPWLRAVLLVRGLRPEDPPALTADDLAGAPTGDFAHDFGALTWAALHDPERRLLPRLMACDGATLVAHPGGAIPASDAAFLTHVLRDATPPALPTLLTWAPALPEAAERTWAMLAVAGSRAAPGPVDDAVRAALTRLAVASPTDLARMAAIVQPLDGSLSQAFRFAETLGEAIRARHRRPEVEAVRALLASGARR